MGGFLPCTEVRRGRAWKMGKNRRLAATHSGARSWKRAPLCVAANPLLNDKVAEAPQPDFLASDERLAVLGADRPAPVTRTIAQVIQDRGRRGGPAFDELGTVAGDGLHLVFQ